MNKKLIRILFICKKRLDEYGVPIGLINSAKFIVDYLNDNGFSSKLVTVVDSNEIDREVSIYKPTHVVLEALWCPPYKIKELLSIKRYKNINWQIRVHSKIPFIANEGIALEWICEYLKISKDFDNLHLVGNHQSFSDAIKETFNKKCYYLPNIYYPKVDLNFKKNKKDYDAIDIGCFGAIRPMKNHLIQAMAAISFGNLIGRKIRFHINASRTEQKGEQVLKNLINLFKCDSYVKDHELVEHEWLNHKDFLHLVSTMDIGMQVSLSETFNIVSADFVTCGLPIIVSDEIEWLPSFRKVNSNNIKDISNKLSEVWHYDMFFLRMLDRIGLEKYNDSSYEKWKDYLFN